MKSKDLHQAVSWPPKAQGSGLRKSRLNPRAEGLTLPPPSLNPRPSSLRDRKQPRREKANQEPSCLVAFPSPCALHKHSTDPSAPSSTARALAHTNTPRILQPQVQQPGLWPTQTQHGSLSPKFNGQGSGPHKHGMACAARWKKSCVFSLGLWKQHTETSNHLKCTWAAKGCKGLESRQ